MNWKGRCKHGVLIALLWGLALAFGSIAVIPALLLATKAGPAPRPHEWPQGI